MAVAPFTLQLRFVVTCPPDEIAGLLQFAGAETMVKIGRQQTVLLFQSSQFCLQPVNVPDDFFACHGHRLLHRPAGNKPAEDRRRDGDLKSSLCPSSSTNLAVWKVIGRDCSPIYHVTTNLPPVLIVNGDADTLVPLEQSEWFRDKAREYGLPVKIVIHRGDRHRWLTMPFDVGEMAD